MRRLWRVKAATSMGGDQAVLAGTECSRGLGNPATAGDDHEAPDDVGVERWRQEARRYVPAHTERHVCLGDPRRRDG